MVNNEFNGHVGIWPRTDQMPTYSIRSGYESCPCEVSLRLAAGWSIHLPATADGGAYLRRLAAVIAECADAVEERAARIKR